MPKARIRVTIRAAFLQPHDRSMAFENEIKGGASLCQVARDDETNWRIRGDAKPLEMLPRPPPPLRIVIRHVTSR